MRVGDWLIRASGVQGVMVIVPVRPGLRVVGDVSLAVMRTVWLAVSMDGEM